MAFGAVYPTAIAIKGEPLKGYKIVQQAFQDIGYRFEPLKVDKTSESENFTGRVSGFKPFDFVMLQALLTEEGVQVEQAVLENETLVLGVNVSQSEWKVPVLDAHGGEELPRSSSPFWFKVTPGDVLRFEPPYEGKWYPDIVFLDSQLRVVYAYQSSEPKSELEVDVPQDGFYMKVSNLQGMKLLRNGMWIQSVSSAQ